MLNEKEQISNKERVKKHRERRKEAGLKEIKCWVRESDMTKVFKVLEPFLRVANNLVHSNMGGKYPKHKLSSKDRDMTDN